MVLHLVSLQAIIIYTMYIFSFDHYLNGLNDHFLKFKQLDQISDSSKAIIDQRNKSVIYSIYLLLSLGICCVFLNALLYVNAEDLNVIIKMNNYYFNFYKINVVLNILFYFVYYHVIFIMTNSAWFIALLTTALQYQLIVMNNDIDEFSRFCEELELWKVKDKITQREIFRQLRALIIHYNIIYKFKIDFQQFLYYRIPLFHIASLLFICVNLVVLYAVSFFVIRNMSKHD